MTVAALASSADYLENGVTLDFAVPFRFLVGTLEVSRVLADMSVVALVQGSDYSATGGDTDAGGTLTLVSTIAGATLRVRRATERAQVAQYTTSDIFPAASHEGALDRQMLIAQEQDAQIVDFDRRSFKVPDGEMAGDLPPAAERALRTFSFGETGDPLLAALPNYELLRDLPLQEAAAGQTVFVFAGLNGLVVELQVNGVALSQGSYSVSGETVTFVTPRAQGDIVKVRTLGAFSTALRGRAEDVSYVPLIAAASAPGSTSWELSATVSLENFGGVGDAGPDGGTDNSAALAKAIAFLGAWRPDQGRRGRSYYFANPPVLPLNVRLLGEGIMAKERQVLPKPTDYSSTIVLPWNRTLACKGSGSQVSGWLIWRKGLHTPTYPLLSMEEADAIIAAYAGTAVSIEADDCEVSNNMILGFNLAIKATGVFRPRIRENHMDNTNGIDVSACYDAGELPGVSNNRCWGYVFGSQPYPWRVSRRFGTAFYFHDGADGLIAKDNFSYGYDVQVRLKDVYGMRLIGWHDNTGFGAPGDTAGCIGLKTEGSCSNLSVVQFHVDAQDTSYYFGHTHGQVTLMGCTSGIAITNQIYFGPGSSGHIAGMLIGGNTGTPISIGPGVGKWSGTILANSPASSGQLFFFTDLADRAKLWDLRVTQMDTALGDALQAGTADAPRIRPNPNIASGMFLDGDPLAFAVKGKKVGQFAADANPVNYPSFQAQGTGQRVLIGAAGADTNIDIQLAGKGVGAVYAASNFLFATDNAFSIGNTLARATAVWAANGTIQTSDPSQKTDIAAIDPALAMTIVQLIDPITFKWLVGGNIIDLVTQEVEVQATETREECVPEIQMIDGQAVEVMVTRPVEIPLFDDLPVVDADGAPVMVASEVRTVGKNQTDRPLVETVMVQKTHRVPRMVTVIRPMPVANDRPGDRTHWGFNARQVQEAFAIVDRDFGGFVIAEDGSLALRPDQMIPILWAALRVLAGLPVPSVPAHPDYLIGAAAWSALDKAERLAALLDSPDAATWLKNVVGPSIEDRLGQDTVGFGARSALVAAQESFWRSGFVQGGRIFYVKDGGVDILDMPDWSPFGDSTPQHHGAIGGDGVADDSGPWAAFMADRRAKRVPAGDYKVDGVVRSFKHDVFPFREGVAPLSVASYPPSWLGGRDIQIIYGDDEADIAGPMIWLQRKASVTGFVGQAALGLAVNAEIMPGVDSTHSCIRSFIRNKGLNNDAVANWGVISNESDGGMSCGTFGGAYVSNTIGKATMGIEAHIYNNARTTAARDGSGTDWLTAYHCYSDSTFNPAHYGILIGSNGATVGRYGFWNGIGINSNAFMHNGVGTGVVGTVGINMAWVTAYAEIGIKLGAIGKYHFSRAGGTLYFNSNELQFLSSSGKQELFVRPLSTSFGKIGIKFDGSSTEAVTLSHDHSNAFLKVFDTGFLSLENLNSNALIRIGNYTSILSKQALWEFQPSIGQVELFARPSTFGKIGIKMDGSPTENVTLSYDGSNAFLKGIWCASSFLSFDSGGSARLRLLANGHVQLIGLPTSASGLETGAIWNDGGTLKVAA